MQIPRFICGVLLAAGLAVGGAAAETLVIGAINDNVKKELKRTEPLAAYLATELADAGVTDVEIAVIPSSGAMAQALAEGTVDIMFDSPLIAAKVARASGAEPFVRRWKRGIASYHSVILVPADSQIETLADLQGKRIGFQEPDSTSGFMLPAGLIRPRGAGPARAGFARGAAGGGRGRLCLHRRRQELAGLAAERLDRRRRDRSAALCRAGGIAARHLPRPRPQHRGAATGRHPSRRSRPGARRAARAGPGRHGHDRTGPRDA